MSADNYPMICNSENLSPDQKAIGEALLGRRVQQDYPTPIRLRLVCL
jgi:hypothetical protein